MGRSVIRDTDDVDPVTTGTILIWTEANEDELAKIVCLQRVVGVDADVETPVTIGTSLILTDASDDELNTGAGLNN